MNSDMLKTPVCLIIFKRPETTKKVFEALRQVKPTQLLVVADGPRPDKPGELEKCQATRQIIETVDWKCQVFKNYADTNMGLKHRVASGLDWVFNTVEEAIILEDDCLPDPTFFQFCEELLDYYYHQPKVMVITGTNFLLGNQPNEDSYYFSRYIDCWGWATWRRAWQYFDFEMKQWPELRDNNWLSKLLKEPQVTKQWTRTFQATFDGRINSWAFRWKFACWLQDGLTIVPEKNLVSNIGFNSEDSTNTVNVDTLLANTPVEEITFPLKHPEIIDRNPKVDEFIQKIVFTRDLSFLRKKMAKLWLSLTKEDWEIISQQEITKRVINICTVEKLLTNTNPTIVKELITNMSQELDELNAIQNLLVAMLYAHPHKLPMQYDLSQIPQWLIKNYLKFTWETPQLFEEVGEVESYYSYLKRWVNQIFRNIENNPNLQLWQQAALSFTQYANFKPLYQTTVSLKDLYEKRTKIAEFILKGSGHPIDYDFPQRQTQRNKIRLGILANNLAIHPETFTTLPIYKFINRDRFEIVIYSLEASSDRLERYCAGHADAGVQLPENLANQVQTIRGEDLDILFIANNVTAELSPIALLAIHRLARVQVVGMNSPVTTGMTHVDFYISGKLSQPDEELQNNYTEKLVTLDGLGFCLDYGSEAQVLPSTSLSRESLGIPENAAIYTAAANFYEITPEVETAWIEIMERVPNSWLILYSLSKVNRLSSAKLRMLQQRFKTAMTSRNMEQNRLIVVSSVQNCADIREVLQLADIGLDTYPSSNIFSLVESLEMGLPTVVIEGKLVRSRISSSVLRELEMPNLIAESEPAYIKLAVSLGTNADLRQQTSDRLKQKFAKKPSFLDSYSYSTKMGELFQKLFQSYLADTLSDNLSLRDINFIIFPDWTQAEETVGWEFQEVIKNLVTHPDRAKMTLLIDNSNITAEDADLILSSVAMNLLMEEELEIDEGPEIVLVGELSQVQWSALIPQLQSRIKLEHENGEAIAQIKAENIPIIELNNLARKSFCIHKTVDFT